MQALKMFGQGGGGDSSSGNNNNSNNNNNNNNKGSQGGQGAFLAMAMAEASKVRLEPSTDRMHRPLTTAVAL